MSRRRILAAAAGAAALLAAGTALAYVRATGSSGLCLWWGSRQIAYLVNGFAAPSPAANAQYVCSTSPASDAAAVAAAVQASFATWTQATLSGQTAPCTDLRLSYGGQTANTSIGSDGQNVVLWRALQCGSLCATGDQSCADARNCWIHSDPKTIALTTTSYKASTGEIVDADVELNAWDGTGLPGGLPPAAGFYFTCVDPPYAGATLPACPAAQNPPNVCLCGELAQGNCIYMDVQNTVTHEAGHFLGLGHSTVPDATMYASAPPGETSKRVLAQDDVEGICAIYPAGKATVTCVPPGSGGCGCGGGGPGGLLGLAALLLLWRRRPRRQ